MLRKNKLAESAAFWNVIRKERRMEKLRRPLAIICLVFMGILIVGAIALAVIGTEEAAKLLMADLFCLMVVPAVFYGYQMFLNGVKKKREEEKE